MSHIEKGHGPATLNYCEGWERIFGRKTPSPTAKTPREIYDQVVNLRPMALVHYNNPTKEGAEKIVNFLETLTNWAKGSAAAL